MAWSDHLARLNASAFSPAICDEAVWQGISDPVWIMLAEPDVDLSYGQSSTTAAARIIEVERRAVPSPAKDQVVTVGVRTFTLLSRPKLSDDGSVWRCEARES